MHVLDPKTMKNEGFTPSNMDEITPTNEGNVGSHGIYTPQKTNMTVENPTLNIGLFQLSC